MVASDGVGDVVLTNGDEGQLSRAQPSFGEVLAETRGAMARLARVRTEAEHVSVTETSPDGHVSVTVNSGGVPTDLRITDEALSQTGAQVAAAVMATMRRAQGRLAGRMGEVMQATIGDDKATMDRVLDVYRDRFPEPEPDEPAHSVPNNEMRFDPAVDEPPAPAPAPVHRRPRHAADDDEWEAGGSIMKS